MPDTDEPRVTTSPEFGRAVYSLHNPPAQPTTDLIAELEATFASAYLPASQALAMYGMRDRILAALRQAEADRAEVERLRDKHNPDCDALDCEPSGIVKPCNCIVTQRDELAKALELRTADLELYRAALSKWLGDNRACAAVADDCKGEDGCQCVYCLTYALQP
jgi:hypothetical protein